MENPPEIQLEKIFRIIPEFSEIHSWTQRTWKIRFHCGGVDPEKRQNNSNPDCLNHSNMDPTLSKFGREMYICCQVFLSEFFFLVRVAV